MLYVLFAIVLILCIFFYSGLKTGDDKTGDDDDLLD